MQVPQQVVGVATHMYSTHNMIQQEINILGASMQICLFSHPKESECIH